MPLVFSGHSGKQVMSCRVKRGRVCLRWHESGNMYGLLVSKVSQGLLVVNAAEKVQPEEGKVA